MLQPATYQSLCEEVGRPDILPLIRPELPSDVSREQIELGAKIVALKLGDRGLYLRTAGLGVLEALGHARPLDASAWANRELWCAGRLLSSIR